MGGARGGGAGPEGADLAAAPPRASRGRPGGPGAPPTALQARLRRRERRIPPPAARGGEGWRGEARRGEAKGGMGRGPGWRREEARLADRGGPAGAGRPSALLPPCACRGLPRRRGSRRAPAHTSGPPRPPSPGRVGGGGLSRQIQGGRQMATRFGLPHLVCAEAARRGARSLPGVTWGARPPLYL